MTVAVVTVQRVLAHLVWPTAMRPSGALVQVAFARRAHKMSSTRAHARRTAVAAIHAGLVADGCGAAMAIHVRLLRERG